LCVACDACWFACALSPRAKQPLMGPACVSLIMVFAIWTSKRPSILLAVIGQFVLIGVLVDTAQTILGSLRFVNESGPRLGVLPLWYVSIWVNFGCVAEYLAWFSEYPFAAAVSGGIFGPLAYKTGQQLQAMIIQDPFGDHTGDSEIGFVLIGVQWFILTPCLARLSSNKLRGG